MPSTLSCRLFDWGRNFARQRVRPARSDAASPEHPWGMAVQRPGWAQRAFERLKGAARWATGGPSCPVRATRACMAACVSAWVVWAAPAQAAPVVYDITFTLTTGTSAPTGSFTFDPTVGPDGTFSDFIVNHRGVAHNFTAKANASGFDILAGLTACPSNQVWAFFDYENQNVYALFASNASLPADPEFMPWMGFLAVSNSIPNGDGADDGGTFTIAARNPGLTVSEPMTLLLVGLSVAGLSAMRRRGPARTVG